MGTLQRVEFLKRRSDFGFFQNILDDFNIIIGFSDNSDGSGGLGKVF